MKLPNRSPNLKPERLVVLIFMSDLAEVMFKDLYEEFTIRNPKAVDCIGFRYGLGFSLGSRV